jgi:hypothetical protein
VYLRACRWSHGGRRRRANTAPDLLLPELEEAFGGFLRVCPFFRSGFLEAPCLYQTVSVILRQAPDSAARFMRLTSIRWSYFYDSKLERRMGQRADFRCRTRLVHERIQERIQSESRRLWTVR